MFLEGPVWRSGGSRLFYSDLRGNAIYQWTAADGAATTLKPFFRATAPACAASGRTASRSMHEGRLLVCVYGSRSVIRIEKDGTRTTLADRFEGKRLNSPNDLVVARDGTVYFTDPSFGLEGMDNSPLRELHVQRRVSLAAERRAGAVDGRAGAAERSRALAGRVDSLCREFRRRGDRLDGVRSG